jgi:outer membrane protein OmpA-like peptidoglycan-associated protein
MQVAGCSTGGGIVRKGARLSEEQGTKNPEPGTRLWHVALALLAFVAPASATFNSPTLLFDTPTADVLPAGALAVSADVTDRLIDTPMNVGFEKSANVRFSPLKHLDFAVNAYTRFDYVLDAKYQILGGEPDHFRLAVGVSDVGFNSYVSPFGHGLEHAYPDWKYPHRTMENFSAFAVTSIPLASFARLNVGLGRGRFVGYGPHGKYFNSDIFFNEYHQWALGLFGGVEVYVTPHVALVAEASGRDLNTGVKANFGPISAAVAWTKMEGLIFPKGDDRFGRIEVGVSYQFDNLFRSRASVPPPEPESTPEPEPESVAVEPVKLDLVPIHFDFDKWAIRPGDATILQGDYDQLRQAPQTKVTIEGYCDPIGTSEYNMALGMRRAEAAKAYLVKLGADVNMFSTISYGEEKLVTHDALQFELNRRCEFKVKD